MSRIFTTSALAGIAMVVSGCGGKGGGGAPFAAAAPVARALTTTFSQGPSDLQNGSVVAISQTTAGEVVFRFTDGPLKDMIVMCQDHATGDCNVVGGPAGTVATGKLQGRMSGQHAYATTLQLQHDQDGTLQNSHHRVFHAAPGTSSLPPALPRGFSTYDGKFAGGAQVGARTGLAEGDIRLTVNFDSARISGIMNGSIENDVPVHATFNNLAIARATGQFASDATSSFTFNNQRATGAVSGGFYGPTAQEAAGVFEMGAESGDGMSGIFVACADTTAPCVSYGR
jgi:hypothetical protein